MRSPEELQDQWAQDQLATTDPILGPELTPNTALLAQWHDQARQRFTASVHAGVQTNPETAGKAQRVAQELGLPVETVARTLEQSTALARTRQLERARLAAQDPVLAMQYERPEFAAVAHDQFEALEAVQTATRLLGAFGSGAVDFLGTGLQGASLSLQAGARRVLGALQIPETGEPTTTPSAYLGRAGQAIAAWNAETLTPSGRPSKPEQVAQGLGQFGAQIATALVPGGQYAALPLMFGQGAKQQADKIAADPVAALAPQTDRDLELLTGGAITAATEWLSTKFALALPDTILLKQKLVTYAARVAAGATEEAIQEYSENILQDVAHQAFTNPEARVQWSEAADSAEIGAYVGGIAQALLSAGLHMKARGQQRAFAQLHDAAKAQQLRDRAPEQYHRYSDAVAQHLAQSTDGAVTEVYIDAGTFRQALTAAHLNPEAIAGALPGVDLAASEAAGGDVVVPMGTWVGRVAGTAVGDALTPHVRATPEALSITEVQQAQAQQVPFREQAEQILAQQTETAAFTESAREVSTLMFNELAATGRYTDAESRAQAQFVRDFVVVQAAKAHVLPAEFFERYRYRVTQEGGAAPEARAFSQAAVAGADPTNATEVAEAARLWKEQGTASPYFKKFFGQSKVVDAKGQPLVVYRALVGEWDDVKAAKGNVIWAASTADGAHDYVSGMAGANITPVFIALQNPADIRQDKKVRKLVRGAGGDPDDLLAVTDSTEVKRALQAAGYDGLQVFHYADQAMHYAAFFPTQIKSATANQGTFDPNDPNILRQSLSTRLPSAVKATEDPLNETLAINYDITRSDTVTLGKNIKTLQATPNLRRLTGPGARNPGRNAEAFIDHVVQNLLFLYDAFPAALRERAEQWYDGGRKTIEAWATRYGISEMQGAATIAVLSPQNGWYANMSAAERLIDILFSQRGTRWDDAMTAEALRIAETAEEPDLLWPAAVGKTLGELLAQPDLAARWIRVYDQTYNQRAYRVLTPEGGVAGYATKADGSDATMAWKSYGAIAKGISILTDGRTENVYYQLGQEHKVRNFYNNLFAPNSPLGFTTIDTHAVAAALLRPLSSKSLEVNQAFGSAGSSSSSKTGLNGTYPLYVEAYRRAAEAKGILPRQMQSITWEAVRGLFESGKKRGLQEAAEAVWLRYKRGEIEQAQAQREILTLAGGITDPSWAAVPQTDTVARTYAGASQAAIDAKPALGAAPSHLLPRVVFEVAPDPHDAALTARWTALTPEARLRISQDAAAQIIPKILQEAGTSGTFTLQLGGYLGATNPSLTLEIDRPELAMTVAKLLGFALSQDSMMVVSETPVTGTEPVGAVVIDLPEGYGEREVTALYDTLWTLERDGQKLVTGHTTANGHMSILNQSGLDNAEFTDIIDQRLGGTFTVRDVTVFAAFLGKESYEYGDQKSAAARRPHLEGRAHRLRREATARLAAHLDGDAGRLQQAAPSGARGGFDPKRLTTILNAQTNSSTFLHETAHFFLTVYSDLAAQPNAPAQTVADMQALLQWFGVADLATWNAMPLEAQRRYHEQFAYNYEIYLFEGKAPSSSLQAVFDRFSAWLRRVYRSIRDELNVTYREQHGVDLPLLTGEVRQVMDRMLASEEQIRQAEAVHGMAPLFQTAEQAGMNADEWAAYEALHAEAQDTAVHDLQQASLKQMQWLSRAQGRLLKQLQAKADAARARIRATVEAEVAAEPVYRAITWLRRGEMTDAQGADVKVAAGYKLDRPTVQAMYPEGDGRLDTDRLDWTALGVGPGGLMVAEGGLHPDLVATMFGFPSGDAMIRTILRTPAQEDEVHARTDTQMLAEHGDLATSAALHVAVERAVHNEARGRFVAVELRHLAKAMQPVRVLQEAARLAARAILNEQAVGHIKPHQYAAAEARAAKAATAALIKRDPLAAIQAKRQQLLQHSLAAEAIRVNEDVAEGLQEFRHFFTADPTLATRRDLNYVNAGRAILAHYGFGDQALPASAYLDQIAAYDPDTYAEIAPLITAHHQAAKPVTELTTEQFREVREQVGALWHLARRTLQLKVNGQWVQRQEAVDDLLVRVAAMDTTTERRGYAQALTDRDKTVTLLMGARAALRRVESWVDVMDGGQLDGPFRTVIWTPISEAVAAYRLEKVTYLERYLAILKRIEKGLAGHAIAAPELRYTFKNKGELLHAILHTGNASNLRKLVLGRRWGTENDQHVLDLQHWDAFLTRMWDEQTLTKDDYDAVQQIWDLLESTKPAAQAAHKDLYGRYFAEITAHPVVTPFGTYRGGYVPAVTDPWINTDAAVRNEQETQQTDNSFMFPTAGRGFTKGRVEYNRPLLLDLGFVPSHLDKVLRFIHLEAPIKDAAKILKTDKRMAAALDQLDPTLRGDMLVPWLQRTAQQMIVMPSKGMGGKLVQRISTAIRTRTGLQMMVANVTNAFQQVTGWSLAAIKVRPRHLRNALWTYVRQPGDTSALVAARSSFMRTRMSTQQFEINHTIEELLLDPSRYDQLRAFAQQHGYFLQQHVQNTVDTVTWIGAYDQALEQGALDAEAVRAADAAVRLTQGSFAPEDLSRFEAGSAFVRIFTMFYSYFNMQANLLATEYTKVAREVGVPRGAGRLLYLYTFAFMVPAVLSELIVQAAGGFDDGDDDEYDLYDAMRLFFGSQIRTALAFIPGVGQLVNSALNHLNAKQYDDRLSISPAVATLEATIDAPFAVYKAIAKDGSWKKAAKETLTALGMITNLPLGQLGKPVGYVLDVQQGKATPSSGLDVVRGLLSGRDVNRRD